MLARRTLVIVSVPFVLIGLAVAWILISPLFIRPTLVEESPFAAQPAVAPVATTQAIPRQSAALATQQATSGPAGVAPAAAEAPAPGGAPAAAVGPAILARGRFDEKDSVHRGSGTAILARAPDGKAFIRFEDFSVTNGPDLFVFLSAHPTPGTSAELHEGGLDINLGALKAPQGAFAYEIPAEVDLSKVKSVAIYCRAFRVMFSSAELQAP